MSFECWGLANDRCGLAQIEAVKSHGEARGNSACLTPNAEALRSDWNFGLAASGVIRVLAANDS